MLTDPFKDYVPPTNGRGKYDLLVAVAGRLDSPGPRDSCWEYILDAGRDKLEKVLNREPIGAGPHFFVFPDRWLTPPEASAFTDHLNKNPDASKFGRVYVVTHQPYIVSGCRRQEVRILTKAP